MKLLLLGLLALSSCACDATPPSPADGPQRSIVAGPFEVDEVDYERVGKLIYGYGRLAFELTMLVRGLTGVEPPTANSRADELEWAEQTSEEYFSANTAHGEKKERFQRLLAAMRRLEKGSSNAAGKSEAELDSLLGELERTRNLASILNQEMGKAGLATSGPK